MRFITYRIVLNGQDFTQRLVHMFACIQAAFKDMEVFRFDFVNMSEFVEKLLALTTDERVSWVMELRRQLLHQRLNTKHLIFSGLPAANTFIGHRMRDLLTHCAKEGTQIEFLPAQFEIENVLTHRLRIVQ